LAISDLHPSYSENRDLLRALPRHAEDWLAVAGDLAAGQSDLLWGLECLLERFARVIWVPGNHELWSSEGRSGPDRYSALVALCRERGVLTPEDPFPIWEGPGGPALIAPLFALYDHSFRPPHVARERVRRWARRAGLGPVDARAIDPAPHASVDEWCAERVRYSERRLLAAGAATADPPPRSVLINHHPLRADLVRLVRIFRFGPWCGTTRTADWPWRFAASVVVSGHLHMPATEWRRGVRFEEVSHGYPHERAGRSSAELDLREILPGPGPKEAHPAPHWRR